MLVAYRAKVLPKDYPKRFSQMKTTVNTISTLHFLMHSHLLPFEMS